MSNQNPLGDTPHARGGATAGSLGAGSTTDQLTSRAHEGLDTLADRANLAERRVRDKAAKVGEQVGQAAGRARAKSAQVKQTVSEYTGENPMMSIWRSRSSPACCWPRSRVASPRVDAGSSSRTFDAVRRATRGMGAQGPCLAIARESPRRVNRSAGEQTASRAHGHTFSRVHPSTYLQGILPWTIEFLPSPRS